MSLDFLLSILKALLSFSEYDNKIRGGEEFRGLCFSIWQIFTQILLSEAFSPLQATHILCLKWKKVESESHSVVSSSLRLHGLYSPWILQARILEWVDFPFSRGSSQPRDWTQVSHIAGGFFTTWATLRYQEKESVSRQFLQTPMLHPIDKFLFKELSIFDSPEKIYQ